MKIMQEDTVGKKVLGQYIRVKSVTWNDRMTLWKTALSKPYTAYAIQACVERNLRKGV
jgi:hypothetical protein